VVERSTGSAGRLTATEVKEPPKRNPLSRVTLGHVLMVLAGLLALVFNLAVIRGNQATIAVAVAAGEIRSGMAITDDLVTVRRIPDDRLLADHLLGADAVDAVIGSVATRTIAPGEPILISDVRAVETRDGLRAMSVPVDKGRAVAGGLHRGDRVDVVAVDAGLARFIALDVEVIDVPTVDSRALGATSSWTPTLAVTDEQALRIAAALDSGEVHLVRSTGAPDPVVEQATAEGAPTPEMIEEGGS
jgi:Flp pilus assembly protein CpaB